MIKSDDTDILILCLAFIQPTLIGLLNRPLHKTPGLYLERSGSTIDTAAFTFPENLRSSLMVLPAVFGCDTTSLFYTHLLVQTLVPGKWTSLRREMDVFKDPGSTHEQIHEAGLKIVAAHFSTDQNSVSEKLNEAREIQFTKKYSSKSTKRGVNLASSVPSEDSVCLHLDRTYFQIQDWQGNALEPTDYGWSPSLRGKTLHLSALWR